MVDDGWANDGSIAQYLSATSQVPEFNQKSNRNFFGSEILHHPQVYSSSETGPEAGCFVINQSVLPFCGPAFLNKTPRLSPTGKQGKVTLRSNTTFEE